LLSKFEKEKVISFLTSNQEAGDDDELLKICEENDIPDAIAYLYEKKGEIKNASEYITKKLEKLIQSVQVSLKEEAKIIDPEDTLFVEIQPIIYENEKYDELETEDDLKNMEKGEMKEYEYDLPKFKGMEIELSDEVNEILKRLYVALSIFERNTISKTIDEEEINNLWFKLVERFYEPLKELRRIFKTKKDDQQDNVKVEYSKEYKSDKDDIEFAIEEVQSDLQDYLKSFNENKIDEATYMRRVQSAKDSLQSHQEKLKILEIKENERIKKEKEKLEKLASVDLPKLVNLWLQRIYHHMIMIIIRRMVTILPIPVIIQRLVSDHYNEEFFRIKKLILRLQARYE
jgi:hypothetical protein